MSALTAGTITVATTSTTATATITVDPSGGTPPLENTLQFKKNSEMIYQSVSHGALTTEGLDANTLYDFVLTTVDGADDEVNSSVVSARTSGGGVSRNGLLDLSLCE